MPGQVRHADGVLFLFLTCVACRATTRIKLSGVASPAVEARRGGRERPARRRAEAAFGAAPGDFGPWPSRTWRGTGPRCAVGAAREVLRVGEGDFPERPERDEFSTNQQSPSTGSGRTGGGADSRKAAFDGNERICSARHRALQITRAGERKLFDKRARKAFLEWFAATGNVVWSAEKVGYSDKTVWKHRMNDPRFAEAFDRAFEQSVMRNKARMVERKARPIAVDGGVGEAELEDCDLEKAWPLIVEVERAKARTGGGGAPIGRPRNRGRMPRAASNAQVRKELEKRLRAFGRRMRAEGKAPAAWLPPVEPRKSAGNGDSGNGDSH